MKATKSPLDFNETDKPPLHRRFIDGMADLFDREKRERDEQRKADQKDYRQLSDLMALRDLLTVEHEATVVAVDLGDKTDRALFHSNRKLFDAGKKINRLTGEVFERLVQSCPDKAMQRRHKELREAKRPQCAEIGRLSTKVGELSHERTQIERNRASLLESLEKQGIKTLPTSVVNDLQQLDRRLADATSSIDEHQQKLDAAVAVRDASIKEMAALRVKMAAV